MADSTGARVYEVRRALGPSPRRPMAQDAFAALLTERGTRTYYGPEISNIELGKKPLTLDDVATIASVDPLRRGKLWLGWGEPERGMILDEEIARLRAERDAAVAESARLRSAAGGRRRPKRPPDPK